MKKLIAILAALLILSTSLGALAVPAVNRCTLGPFGFTVPTDMRRVQSGDGDSTRIDYENSSGDTVVCSLATVEVDASDVFGLNLYYTSVVSGIGLQNPATEIIDIGGHSAMLWRGAYPVQGGSALRAAGLVYHRGATSLVIAFYSGHMPEDNLYDCARQIAESITYTDPPTVYQTKRIEFSINGPYLYHDEGTDYVVLGYDWTNISEEPQSFDYMITATCYQHGREVSDYSPRSFYQYNTSDKFLPGYGTRNYDIFNIDSLEDEVTIYVDDGFDVSGKFDDIKLTAIPSELPEFDGVPNR